jgi:hypothetical protein
MSMILSLEKGKGETCAYVQGMRSDAALRRQRAGANSDPTDEHEMTLNLDTQPDFFLESREFCLIKSMK